MTRRAKKPKERISGAPTPHDGANEQERRFGELAVYSGSLQPVVDELLERPFVPMRRTAYLWRFNSELTRRAERNGTTKAHELLLCARLALSLAIPEIRIPARLYDGGDLTPARDYARHELRRLMNEEVTRDLLGPGYRKAEREDSSDALLMELAIGGEPEPSAEDTLAGLERAGLTPREMELCAAISSGQADSLAEAARVIGVSPSTARTLAERIRDRLRKKSPTL